ncbi:MAG TPA: YbaK/EbsC family protein [Bacteroidota bacterium]|nr:YbaK/EbsC family protein [Bacteroidota bacterium]
MILKKLVEFLDTNAVKYTILSHSLSYTALEVAHSVNLPGKEIAKTVIVWMDGQMAMVVLPGTSVINFTALREQVGAKNIELASESEFSSRFPECEVGAMPPFGNLFGMPVIAATTLAEDREIAFNAGSHHELVRMGYDDFITLVKPMIASFTLRKGTFVEDEPMKMY